MPTSEDAYITWVMETIESYKKYSDELTRDEFEIKPPTVQKLMAQYQSVKLGLLMEKQRSFRNFRKAKRSFNSWWNSKLLEAKKELTGEGKKYVAVKDYKVQAEENYKEEYSLRQDELQDFEDKFEFMKELKTDWEGFGFTLNQINDNMKSELRSLCMDFIPKEEKPVRKPRTE